MLVGLGLETKDISVRGLQAAIEADKVLIEQYTLFVSEGYLGYLKNAIGSEILEVGRPELEENAKDIVLSAARENIVILVPGDPLIATTHYATLVETAKKLGVSCKVIHAASVYSAAVGESGLDVYKFGVPVTIAYWSEKYRPTSFLDSINSNLKGNRHTMLLLDLEQKEKRPMSLDEALSLLRSAETEKKLGIITDEVKVLVMGDVGKESQDIAYARLGELKTLGKRFAGKFLVIIVPAQLTFAEEEFVGRFSV